MFIIRANPLPVVPVSLSLVRTHNYANRALLAGLPLVQCLQTSNFFGRKLHSGRGSSIIFSLLSFPWAPYAVGQRSDILHTFAITPYTYSLIARRFRRRRQPLPLCPFTQCRQGRIRKGMRFSVVPWTSLTIYLRHWYTL